MNLKAKTVKTLQPHVVGSGDSDERERGEREREGEGEEEEEEKAAVAVAATMVTGEERKNKFLEVAVLTYSLYFTWNIKIISSRGSCGRLTSCWKQTATVQAEPEIHALCVHCEQG